MAIDLAKSDPRIVLINGDAFAVYKGMEIGTAVPNSSELEGVDFRLLSFLTPSQEYSIAEFQSDCNRQIDDCFSNQKIPIIVGGSALYVLSVLNGFNVPKLFPNVRIRLEREIEEMGPTGMYARLLELDPVAASKIHPSNSRRLIRALEVCIGSDRRFSDYGPGVAQYSPERQNDILLVLDQSQDVLDSKIQDRLELQIKSGFMDEVTKLNKNYTAISKTAKKAIGYDEILRVIEGEISLEDAKSLIVGRTKKFSKRQSKWWKRDDRAIFTDPSRSTLEDIKLLLKL